MFIFICLVTFFYLCILILFFWIYFLYLWIVLLYRKKMIKYKLQRSKLFKAEKHGFHLVRPSPWPFLTSVSLLQIALYTVLVFHSFKTSKIEFALYFIYFLSVVGMWFRDIVIEATYQGFHTLCVQRGLRYGMMTFLLSETMFFLVFLMFFLYVYISINLNWMYLTARRNRTVKPFFITIIKYFNTYIFRN